ncbi:MAG: alanine--tRNA ligase [Cyclobacteriaceae bacterium]
MDSGSVRRRFLSFFEGKGHLIVPSAPLVLKNDPTLLFTNSGMVQFKDNFLGNTRPKSSRIADTQKCLRVSGKHNDLEEVGIDTYHHTMFEMLGNWSFGDYFKKEAIEWAWELLTEEYKLPKERLYVTVFEGDAKEQLALDEEAFNYWKNIVPEDRILRGNKKDNFWEMGEMGPCGPCSEIHIDLRPDEEASNLPGKTLVNTGHPQVVEIWNLVFMEFNRKADGSLEKLPAQHVDTGMGFERLCMAIQKKTSNYDTDVFSPLLNFISRAAGVAYKASEQTDIAMRVMADHVRAVSFAIADGQLPSNTGAGYVIRRILRRAVRYGFTFLNFKDPFLYHLVPVLGEQLSEAFPELYAQQDFVSKVVFEEESAFLRTLDNGMEHLEKFFNSHGEFIKKERLIKNEDREAKIELLKESDESNFSPEGLFQTESIVKKLTESLAKNDFNSFDQALENFKSEMPGECAFELYDTFGFPFDLTSLIARERGIAVDETGFKKEMEKQKLRSKTDAVKETGDWVAVGEDEKTEFIGYDHLSSDVRIVRYRKIKQKNRELCQLVFDKTPFYAESGGQVGDTGYIERDGEKIAILDTRKENELIIHLTETLPADFQRSFQATVDKPKRESTTNNHSATHLLHAALRQVLGKHVEQKGSLVNADILRFDFSHFAAMTPGEVQRVEEIVNRKIRENIRLDEKRNVPIDKAKALGAMALFGEKYGDFVRMITFDPRFSVELCGGTHVLATGNIGLFKIISESSVAAGVRRIEAITGEAAEKYVGSELGLLDEVKRLLKNPKDVITSLKNLADEKHVLEKKLEILHGERANQIKNELALKAVKSNGHTLILEKVTVPNADSLKNIAYALRNQFDDLLLILAADVDHKPQVTVMIGEKLMQSKKFHAGNMVKELAREIDGGGGGQPFFATAGGKNLDGLNKVLEKAREMIKM